MFMSSTIVPCYICTVPYLSDEFSSLLKNIRITPVPYLTGLLKKLVHFFGYIFITPESKTIHGTNVVDPLNFGADPDPRIHTSD